jgi:chromosome segregation ATPase
MKVIVSEKCMKIDAIERELEAMVLEMGGVERALGEARERLRGKGEEVAGLEVEVERMGVGLVEVRGEREGLVERVDELERAAGVCEREIEGFGKERASFGTKAEEFNQEYAKVNAKLLESESSNLILEQNIRTLEKDLGNEQSRSSEAAEKI